MYLRLLADAATVAGVTVLPGFDPKQIHVYRGTAKAGLNLSLDRGDEPGHVGWVDAAGKFGVPLDFSKSVPAVQAGLMISPNAFNDEKAMSMRTIRHEMVHVRHRQITLDAVTKWDAAGRQPTFESGSPRTPSGCSCRTPTWPSCKRAPAAVRSTPRCLPTSRAS